MEVTYDTPVRKAKIKKGAVPNAGEEASLG